MVGDVPRRGPRVALRRHGGRAIATRWSRASPADTAVVVPWNGTSSSGGMPMPVVRLASAVDQRAHQAAEASIDRFRARPGCRLRSPRSRRIASMRVARQACRVEHSPLMTRSNLSFPIPRALRSRTRPVPNAALSRHQLPALE